MQMTRALLAHSARAGQAVGLCLDERGVMFLGVNTPQVRWQNTGAGPYTLQALQVQYLTFGAFHVSRACGVPSII